MFQGHLSRLILALILACSAVAQQRSAEPQTRWKEYSYPKDGFAVIAPSSPDIHSDAVTPDVRVYRWQLGSGVTLSIHTGVRPNCVETLVQAREDLRKDADHGIPGSVRDLSLNGNSGL